MSEQRVQLNRRRFLKTAVQAGAVLAVPQVIPGAALGKDGAVAPSERIVLGGIGIGGRGTYDLGCFLQEPDVQFVAVCDVKAARREAVKKMADAKYGNQDCATYRDLRELLAREDIDAVLIATGPNWHATASILAAKAGKDVYCEKPCTKNIAQSLALAETFRRTGRVFQAGTQRRSLPNFAFAVELARSGKLGKLQTLYAHPDGAGNRQQRLAPGGAGAAQGRGGLGPVPRAGGLAALQPEAARRLQLRERRRHGGVGGGGCLEWGSHCVDLCQWANDADDTAPVEYEPAGRPVARPLCQRRQAGPAQRRLAAAGLLPGAVRRRDRLGGDGRRRRDRRQLAGAARRQGREDRRLPGQLPRPRLPRLREVARPDAGQRRRGLLLAHRLPRRQHRPVPEPQGQLRSRRRTSSSATRRPTGCAPRRCANRGGCERGSGKFDV